MISSSKQKGAERGRKKICSADSHTIARQKFLPWNRKDASSAKSFDRAVALAQVEGDVELLQEMLKEFLRTLPDVKTEIDKAISAANTKRIEDCAHKLKGAAGIIGAVPVYFAAQDLEDLAGRLSSPELQQAHLVVKRELESLHVELVQFLDDRSDSCG